MARIPGIRGSPSKGGGSSPDAAHPWAARAVVSERGGRAAEESVLVRPQQPFDSPDTIDENLDGHASVLRDGGGEGVAHLVWGLQSGHAYDPTDFRPMLPNLEALGGAGGVSRKAREVHEDSGKGPIQAGLDGHRHLPFEGLEGVGAEEARLQVSPALENLDLIGHEEMLPFNRILEGTMR